MTLVELLVAVTIFSMSIAVVSQTFVTAMRLERKFLSTTDSLNSVSYSMEYMARLIRMAKKDSAATPMCLLNRFDNYNLTHYDGTKYNGIKFKTSGLNGSNSRCQEFYLEGGVLKESKNNGAEVNNLTSPHVNVTNFSIGQSGWDQADLVQPRVTLYLELQPIGDTAKIKIQTTISQRDEDVKLVP